jgi:hypothetical protein
MECHYVQGNHESGEMNVNALFKNYVFSWEPWHSNMYVYTLLNPTDLMRTELNKYVLLPPPPYGSPNPVATNRFYVKSLPEPENVRELMRKGEVNYADYFANLVSGPDMNTINMLLEKGWDFVEKKQHEPPNKRTRDITVTFKNEYETIPNVSYMITPLEDAKVTCSIKSIDYTSVTFTLTELNPDTNHQYTFTWHVFGIKSYEDTDLLEFNQFS